MKMQVRFAAATKEELIPKMYEYATEVLIILLQPMVESADVFLLEEAQDVFFELPAPLARDDFNQSDSLLHCVRDDLV